MRGGGCRERRWEKVREKIKGEEGKTQIRNYERNQQLNMGEERKYQMNRRKEKKFLTATGED